MPGRFSRLAPLTGVVSVVLIVLAGLVGGETPSTDDSIREVVSFYDDNEGSQFGASLLIVWGGLFLVFFSAVLRDWLRGPGGPGGLPSLVFAGGVVMAVGLAIFGSIGFALADAHDDIAPTATQALNVLNSDFFFPLALGTAVFMLSSGLAIVTARRLPVWLGWVALVLGVLALTPAGFFALLVVGVWILVVSILLMRQASATVAPASGAPPAAPPPPPA
jgi:hypothetical protein